MTQRITTLDEIVYGFIVHFTSTHDAPPDSMAAVARGTGAPEKSVSRCINKLVHLGILERERHSYAPILVRGPLVMPGEVLL